MRAFINTTATKEQLLSNLEAHARADAFQQGHYWRPLTKKGCAVGCSLIDFGGKASNHSDYQRHFGIPTAIAHLEDRIFEGMPESDSKHWPLQFTHAIPVGADLSGVASQFTDWLVVEMTTKHPNTYHAAFEADVRCYVKTRDPEAPADALQEARDAIFDYAVETSTAESGHKRLAAEQITYGFNQRAATKLIELLKAAPVTEE